jgi:DNA-binding NarL/FixJ family response regulator
VPEYIKQRMHEPEPVKCKGYAFLTDKEHALLVQTKDGLALKEIAANMHIAETTACTVRKNAFRKMGVRSLVDMVKIGVQYNLHSREERAHVVHS